VTVNQSQLVGLRTALQIFAILDVGDHHVVLTLSFYSASAY